MDDKEIPYKIQTVKKVNNKLRGRKRLIQKPVVKTIRLEQDFVDKILKHGTFTDCVKNALTLVYLTKGVDNE